MPQLFVLFMFIVATAWLVFCTTNEKVGKLGVAFAGVAFGINLMNFIQLILRAN